MQKVEGIIFDMDGVLFDSERISLEFWMETFEKYGYTMTKEIYTSVMGRNRKGIIEGLTDIYDSSVPIIDLYDEKTKNMIEFMERKGAPIKLGVNELISFLKENGYKMAVATSTKRERAVKRLAKANLKDYFDAIVCGDDVVNSKPNPEIFLKAAKKINVNPQNCIVIEDSPMGVEAAYNGGIRCINVPDLKEPDEQIKSQSHKILENLLEVREYLKSLNSKECHNL
ncbi:hydrolase, HAD superfamily, IA subfamily [Clostridioides difficile]|uniref:Hydrolase, HAD superfamily, IA subfamily n=3 Tax=Clostridioides difficile TaxID=1496 RepID=A0A031WLC6_CLODI|nr:HAD family phosphatase [Clostridioides difficile]EQG74157.1 HAD hydrolase, IA, variant 1 family protein [Clostridioides difficile DA00165]OFU01197.1 hydrolase [Clostridium sp. HMSC19D07]OFU02431.1 hydrolase [Clostridium sp. HMSC19E03]OFU14930.1 hydrolase [Clostridium sp. HMSC19C08]OFU15227.1 hydrolase [Clostridium sp. HMSC19C09]OFU15786.1 hydrolase [Clostridium sp. HMSC19C11]OFU16304.1 hydrolase [Clostridium sp. HMSC19C05]OFU26998.1 hydrolase [Clostridium sp. HMSC19B10]OFU33024.1 hydrol